MAGRFILGGRARNLGRKQKEAVLSSAGLRPRCARRLGWRRGPSDELSCDSGSPGETPPSGSPRSPLIPVLLALLLRQPSPCRCCSSSSPRVSSRARVPSTLRLPTTYTRALEVRAARPLAGPSDKPEAGPPKQHQKKKPLQSNGGGEVSGAFQDGCVPPSLGSSRGNPTGFKNY